MSGDDRNISELDGRPIVFDTGPLSHFAEAGWLGLLGSLAGGAEAWVPEAVEEEIRGSSHRYPHLNEILRQPWLSVYRGTDPAILPNQASYERRLVAGGKNRGEASVLALAKTFGWLAILDDSEPREIAIEEGIEFSTSVGLLVHGIKRKLIAASVAADIAEGLLRTDYLLPFDDGHGFFVHIVTMGILEPEDLDW